MKSNLLVVSLHSVFGGAKEENEKESAGG